MGIILSIRSWTAMSKLLKSRAILAISLLRWNTKRVLSLRMASTSPAISKSISRSAIITRLLSLVVSNGGMLFSCLQEGVYVL